MKKVLVGGILMALLSTSYAQIGWEPVRSGNSNWSSPSGTTTYQSFGNNTYGSNGSSSTRIGNQSFHSDGSNSLQMGDTQINSNGSTVQRVGNSLFGSDGTRCNIIGNQTICN